MEQITLEFSNWWKSHGGMYQVALAVPSKKRSLVLVESIGIEVRHVGQILPLFYIESYELSIIKISPTMNKFHCLFGSNILSIDVFRSCCGSAGTGEETERQER
jgi:hypothetical protein